MHRPPMTRCQEGFRCVSRVARFGMDHIGEVDAEAGKRVPDRDTPDYEWGCPGEKGMWSPQEFVYGNEPGMCRPSHPSDCLCISRGSSDSQQMLNEGHEKIVGRFDVHTLRPEGVVIQRRKLTVIPHYKMPLLPIASHPEDARRDLGEVVSMPRKPWMDQYYDTAPKMQLALDTLKQRLDRDYREKVEDVPFVCAEEGPTVPSGQQPSPPAFTPGKAREVVSIIRRFQALSGDCIAMQDTAARLAPKLEQERFAGDVACKRLHCFRAKGSESLCQQLNCYRGSDNAAFDAHLQEFKAKMDQCISEAGDAGASVQRQTAGPLFVVVAGLLRWSRQSQDNWPVMYCCRYRNFL